MTLHLKRLVVIATLSTTLAACSTNPVNNNGSVGNTYPNSTANSNTNDTSTNGGGTNAGETTYESNSNTTINNYEGNTSTNDENTTYTEEASNTPNYTDWSSNTNNTSDGNYTNATNQKGFVVQLIASISQQKASNIKNTFASEGYPAIQNTIERNGQTLYRVQIGPYATKEEAKTLLNKMRRRYKRNIYVNAAFINQNQ
jgi:cell division septation protein DedD